MTGAKHGRKKQLDTACSIRSTINMGPNEGPPMKAFNVVRESCEILPGTARGDRKWLFAIPIGNR